MDDLGILLLRFASGIVMRRLHPNIREVHLNFLKEKIQPQQHTPTIHKISSADCCFFSYVFPTFFEVLKATTLDLRYVHLAVVLVALLLSLQGCDEARLYLSFRSHRASFPISFQ